MPGGSKNFQKGGKKSKRGAGKRDPGAKRELVFKEDGQEYGQVQSKEYGNECL
jgi:hypothetical protein